MEGSVKNIILTIVALIALTTGTVFATEPTPVKDVQFGWGPSAVASVGAFYLNGNYKLLSAGFNVGTAYTFEGTSAQNIDSVGFYLGPQSEQTNGVTTISINALCYLDLYKTSAGRFGLGLGTRLWESGRGFRTPNRDTTFLVLGYKF